MLGYDDLLEAVRAAPDDDGPRLVLADWLMERGDPHGEFILLQVRAAHGGTPEQTARLEEIERKHRDAWLAPLRALGVAGAGFERGFVSRLSLDTLTFLNRAAELVQAAPLLGSVTLRLTEPRLAKEIAAHPSVGRLREVDLWTDRYPIGDEGARVLARSPYLERLVSLGLPDMEIGEPGLVALRDARGLRGLRDLNLYGAPLHVKGMRAFVRPGAFPKLERLNLNAAAIDGDAGAATIARAHLPALRHLHMDVKNLTAAAVGYLAESPALGDLETLELGLNLTPSDQARLKRRFPSLRRLE